MDEVRRGANNLWQWISYESHDWWTDHQELTDIVFNLIVLAAIVYLFLILSFSITRRTGLGRWLGNLFLVLAIAFGGALLGRKVFVLESDPWRYVVRFFIMVGLIKALIEMKRAYGGWWRLHKRAWENIVRILTKQPPPPPDDPTTILELDVYAPPVKKVDTPDAEVVVIPKGSIKDG